MVWTAVAVVACIALGLRLRTAAAAGARARAEAGRLAAELQDLRRAANLAAADLRQMALRLHGQAGALRSAPQAAPGTFAQSCRTVAEDLAAAAARPAPPRLDEDAVDLAVCLREAVDGVAAAITPGRRHFRVVPPPPGTALWADRRALRQALARVLGEAALDTGEGDSIAVAVERTDSGGLAVVVEDEGIGLGPADPEARAPGDSRGLSGRLALPRALIEAHGGALEVVAALGTGTRTSLIFPQARVRTMVLAAQPGG